MLRSRFVIGLLVAVIVSFSPIISSANGKSIVLNKTRITDFFKGVSIELNRPIVVSNKAGLYQISGEIDLTNPYAAIKQIANKTNLIWYDDASAIYVYASSELRNEFISVSTENDFNEIVKFLKLSKLYSQSYPLRYTKGAAFVSGPPMYVNVIKDAVAAYYNGLAADEKPEDPEPVEVIKMFPLRNRFVTDMRYYIRGTEKTVDGALTILRRLISERNDDIKHLSIVADTLNNALYVKGMASEVNELKELIDEIDIIREQIQLSLWIIDVDSSKLKEVGTTLEGTVNTDLFKIGLNGGSVILDQSETISFVGAVNSLETQRKAKVLSRPVLITQNNTPAVIDTNETIYVKLIGAEEVSLKEITYGTILSVTPRVVKGPKGNDIEMMVEIEDGNQTADLIDGLPNIRRSVISTIGRINDSQSLLLGGFVRKQVTNQKRGIPILKDIPLVKYLFSMDVENTSSIMRLFMIEPKIIDDPVAEFNRSKIMNLQSESFIKAGRNQQQRSQPQNRKIIKDPMTGKGAIIKKQTMEEHGSSKVNNVPKNNISIQEQQNNNLFPSKVIENRSIINSRDKETTNQADQTKRLSNSKVVSSSKEQVTKPNHQHLKPYMEKRQNSRKLPLRNHQKRVDIIDRKLLDETQSSVTIKKQSKIKRPDLIKKNENILINKPYVMVDPNEIN